MKTSASQTFGRPKPKREVIDILEEKAKDKSLDKLMSVRKQRLERYERERSEARQVWRNARAQLHQLIHSWRDAVIKASDFWQQERTQFFQMTITSGQFRKAKAIYERMKVQAEQLLLESRQAVHECRQKGRDYFIARKNLVDASRQREKLDMLRNEIRQLEQPKE